MEYKKLAELDTFQVITFYGYKWKKYNPETKKVETSEKWQEGFAKRYSTTIQTKAGQFYLELSQAQISQMLEGSLDDKGNASLIDKVFKVKTNGQTGKDIRYYINRVYDTQTPVKEKEEIKVDEIPF